MSEHVPPLELVASPSSTAVQGWEPALPAPAMPKRPMERAIGALRRYRWLILGVFLLSIAGGFLALRIVRPQYTVSATVWIQSETPTTGEDRTGPIRTAGLLSAQAWVELLKSYRIADAVVRKLTLYVKPDKPADLPVFANFAIADRFAPGHYELVIDKSRKRWHLQLDGGILPDSGTATDSLGRRAGLRWLLPASTFSGSGERTIEFTVLTPREAAVKQIQGLDARLRENSNFLILSMSDENPELAARTMNTWLNEFVGVAAELKKKNVTEFAQILAGQLTYAETSLHDAESALENFRVHTITLPAEGGPVAAGITETRDPVLKSYFDQKIEYDNLRHDHDALQKIITDAATGEVPYEAALFIPSVSQSPGAEALRSAFKQLYDKKAELSAARQVYTDNYPVVRDLVTAVTTLEKQTIPQLAAQLLVTIKEREGQFDTRITTASADLQAIPARTIEEMRLRRSVSVAEGLYTTLKTRYAEAQLAEAGATPDLTILDSAVAPLKPAKNTAPRMMAIAILGGLGAAIGLALLLDAMDGKLRYPDQVVNELGMTIAAAIPKFPKGAVTNRSPDQIAHLVEAFRSLRMHVRSSTTMPISVAVSSPAPSDGKSFVSANLAMSFADAGYRTVLVDGDTRRGSAHEVFDLPMKDGLTEYLSGRADYSAIVHRTSHEKLAFVPCGSRQPHSPELLTSAALPRLVAELRSRYDVVIFDTSPLAAGIDAYAISAALGNLVVVLRVGKTERRLTAAKLLLVDRLPINIIGAVLNGVQLKGEFEYYGYATGYGFAEAEAAQAAPAASTAAVEAL
jgi:capsular exopolysaccharide synthesis family protein